MSDELDEAKQIIRATGGLGEATRVMRARWPELSANQAGSLAYKCWKAMLRERRELHYADPTGNKATSNVARELG